MCIHMGGINAAWCNACKGISPASKDGFIPKPNQVEHVSFGSSNDSRMRLLASECSRMGDIRGPKTAWGREVELRELERKFPMLVGIIR